MSSDGIRFETSLGEFEPRLPAYSHGRSRMILHNYVSGKFGVEKAAAVVDELLSESRGPDPNFRNVVGLLGYEMGRNLDDDAEPGDIKRLSSKAYECLQSRTSTAGPDPRMGSGMRDSHLYGVHRSEVERHLQDAMLIGYWDR